MEFQEAVEVFRRTGPQFHAAARGAFDRAAERVVSRLKEEARNSFLLERNKIIDAQLGRKTWDLLCRRVFDDTNEIRAGYEA